MVSKAPLPRSRFLPVPELPFDIIIEILSWLPIDSLLRFKSVCKKWRSLVLDYKFIAKHMVRASPLRLSYQQEWKPNDIFPTILYDANWKYLWSVAGLLLEEGLTCQGRLRIRNFATRQVLYLPDAHERTIGMGFGFNSSTGECKVVCFHNGHELGFKVLSIWKNDNWRTLKLPNQNDTLLRGKWCGTFNANHSKGAAHLVEIIRDREDLKLEVQSFDLWSESFTITTLPRGALSDLNRVTVFLWNEYVAVADTVEDSLNVLVLEDFKEHKWNKITVPLKYLKDNPELKDKIRPYAVRLDDLSLHNAVENYIFVYDMKRGVIKEPRPKSTYDFQKSSLVTLNQGNEE